jgi:hypothetical protein
MLRCLNENEWDKIILMEGDFKASKVKLIFDIKRIEFLTDNILETNKFICRHKQENTSMCYCNECPISILEEKNNIQLCLKTKRFKEELFKVFDPKFDPKEKEKEKEKNG